MCFLTAFKMERFSDWPIASHPCSFSSFSRAFFDTGVVGVFLSGRFLFADRAGLVIATCFGSDFISGCCLTFIGVILSGSAVIRTLQFSSFAFFWMLSDALRAASRLGRAIFERRLRPDAEHRASRYSGVSASRSRMRFWIFCHVTSSNIKKKVYHTLRLMALGEKSTPNTPSELLPDEPFGKVVAGSPFATIRGFSTILSTSELCEFSEWDWCSFLTTSSSFIFFDFFILSRMRVRNSAKFSSSLDDAESDSARVFSMRCRFSFNIWRVFLIRIESFTFFLLVDSTGFAVVRAVEPFSALSLFLLEPAHFLLEKAQK